jgi:general secretion pathway protein D
MAILLSGCATQPSDRSSSGYSEDVSLIKDSYLRGDQKEPHGTYPNADEVDSRSGSESEPTIDSKASEPPEMRVLKPLDMQYETSDFSASSVQPFSVDPVVTVAAETMPLVEFLHYVFGEILEVNYVIDPAVINGSGEQAVTLNFKEEISEARFFEVARRILSDRGLIANLVDDVYFIKADVGASPGTVSFGVGGTLSDVPVSGDRILQMVPVEFGIKVFVPQILEELMKARINPDYQNNTILIEGSRAEVIRAMELIDMFDVPSAKGKYIGMVDVVYGAPLDLASSVSKLLTSEGVDAAVGSSGEKDTLSLVPLDSIGAIVLFAETEKQLTRAEYWIRMVDKPVQKTSGLTLQDYFTYVPKYAMAKDIADSLAPLLSATVIEGSLPKNIDKQAESTGSAPNATRVAGAAADSSLKVLVNARSNSLIFATNAKTFDKILPILKELDFLPKQIMLSVVIAEVTLKDEFKHGVEWAVERGEVSISTQGAFGATGFGGVGLTINGSEGPLNANFIGTNSLVKVISNPSLMVIDGESASINVGSSVSVIGSAVQDPLAGERQITSEVYRDTGLSVSLVPTVTAGDLVKIAVSSSISNSQPGTGASSNPDIFTRDLETTVLAGSGQTIMMGGLISENAATGGSGAPGISKIPLLGNLFKSKSNSKDRSELIMLITPRVMTGRSQWDRVKNDFESELRVLSSAP